MPPPPRPPRFEEAIANALLRVGAPPVARIAQPAPPPELAPFERILAPRKHARGTMGATWFPARGEPVGVVVMGPPWLDWGQSYFHRRGRMEALREAGYAALTFDLGGFGATTETRGMRDRDVADAVALAREREPDAPLHFWGVSSGGYWMHPYLSAHAGVQTVVFEDVSPNLLEWRDNVGMPGHAANVAFRRLFPKSAAYMNMRNHAPHLRVRAAAYVGGGADAGIPEAHTRELAKLAGAECLIVPGAKHLAAIKEANADVLALALRTMRRAG